KERSSGDSLRCVWVLMKPGVTILSLASMISSAVPSKPPPPTCAMRSSSMTITPSRRCRWPPSWNATICPARTTLRVIGHPSHQSAGPGTRARRAPCCRAVRSVGDLSHDRKLLQIVAVADGAAEHGIDDLEIEALCRADAADGRERAAEHRRAL